MLDYVGAAFKVSRPTDKINASDGVVDLGTLNQIGWNAHTYGSQQTAGKLYVGKA